MLSKIYFVIGCAICKATLSLGWLLPFHSSPLNRACRTLRPPSALVRKMALDYNDPLVAEEYAAVQGMAFEEVEAALLDFGIPVPASVNDMDAKLMLVETRLRKSGKMAGSLQKPKPTTFSSEYERLMHECPAFEQLINEMRERGDQNAANVAIEYITNPTIALKRYGESYADLIRQVKKAITMPAPVKSKVLKFSGFPSNMGETGCKMTFEALGPLISFECAESDDFPILTGKVEFENIETAKKAVETYNGMDMGMATKLELSSV
mmetsp:Transcript_10830/g.15646  ORF Transcript_10830/g.15646 Transcript_10830/m.15646 type:complete len:266 (-) Transcript_10830:118-915(-)|eukprot:CAMPEP_0172414794 /NCGR_PEP_ID=MMETSP1064-20121228/1412_1 /TAXON_ID=202472 /ORGANISM="Aulacoseira subarctica , Strain CCAP 1002/5" /LENGTH=265 /DNA_ID=CAMNT_0013151617 /DNA_START=87 /DNA_END=884 /DNA_ORIENTATION=+